MNENLVKREVMRQTMVETIRRDKESNKIDGEDSDYLLKQINEMKVSIESKLENIDQIQGKNEMEESLDQLDSQYETLNKLINDSTLFLAKYSLKSAQTLLNGLRVKIDAKKDSLIPKSKFSFKTTFKANPKPLKVKTENSDQTDCANVESTPFFGFRDMKNCEKPLQLSSEESNGKDIQLEGLESCQIEIFGSPNALKINNLLNCKVFCGPTTTSIFVANCRKCVFKIASQQLRIHTSFDTDFYIFVSSRAIIEDSKRIGFGPYDWSYPNITEDFKSADLDINTNNWRQIDDFDSLSSDKSINWSFIDSNH